MGEMTSRERFFTSMAHREPDRVPLFCFSLDPKFIKEFGKDDLLAAFEYLNVDTWFFAPRTWCGDVPSMAALHRDFDKEESLGGGVFAGWNGVDDFGRLWKRGSYIDGALHSRNDLDRFIPPLRLEERIPPNVLERYRARSAERVYGFHCHLGPFGLTMESMGHERFFYALYDDRDFVREVIRRRSEWFIELARYAERLGADYVIMGDDVAYKGKTFVSPEDFRDLAIPHYKQIAASLKVPLFWHTDGFIEPYLELAIEAGIKGIHPLEPAAGNDLGRIKEEYGERLVLIGNVDATTVLRGTDLAAVRQEVDRCYCQAKRGGGYMLETSSSLNSECSFEAAREMYRYGLLTGAY